MEYLDIRNEDGSLTGRVKERSLAHRDGDLHGTAHVWLVRKNCLGRWEVLLQKRSADKDSFPGVYDVSSAGHLPAGEDFRKSAVRELKEELGISAGPEQLSFIGWKGRKFTRSFTAGPGITMNSAPSTRCILTGSRIRCGFRRARWKPFSGQTMRPV